MTGEMHETTAARRAVTWWQGAAVLLMAGIVLVAIRSHAFDLPLETDECNYAYIGDRLLDGDRLYVDVWDHQPPGVFVMFAGIIAVFGDAPAVFRWAAVAASLVTMLLIFAIVRRTGSRWAGWAAAVLFAICSADPGTAGEGCNREIFMNPLCLAGLWLLLRRQRPDLLHVALAGLALGLASALKTVVAAQWLLLAGWVVVRAWRETEAARRLRTASLMLLAFGAGPALVWIATAGYFAVTGRFADFYDAAFAFNLSYSDVSTSYWQRFVDFFRAPVHRYVFSGTQPLWIAAGAAAVALPVIRWKRGLAVESGLLCYLIGSYWAVCLPGQLWPHYYYLMLPALIVVLAATLGYVAGLSSEWHHVGHYRWGAYGAVGLLAMLLLLYQATEYLLVPTPAITDLRYDSRDLWGRAQGEKVARVTNPDDTILVYAHDVGVYYYAHRRCATRFTMLRALSEDYPGFERRRAILLEEVRANRPRVVLVVEEPFPALQDWLRAHYYLAGVDHHDRRQNEEIMAVLMDKQRPIESIDWNWHRSEVLGPNWANPR